MIAAFNTSSRRTRIKLFNRVARSRLDPLFAFSVNRLTIRDNVSPNKTVERPWCVRFCLDSGVRVAVHEHYFATMAAAAAGAQQQRHHRELLLWEEDAACCSKASPLLSLDGTVVCRLNLGSLIHHH